MRCCTPAGKWTLNFLMITLCMTPLQGSDAVRCSGCAFGACSACSRSSTRVLHLLDLSVARSGRAASATFGRTSSSARTSRSACLALLLLVPLAITSTAKSQRRLGRRWTRLHRLVYVVAVLGVWHFWWQVKKDVREPLIYACGLADAPRPGALWKERRSVAPRGSARHALQGPMELEQQRLGALPSRCTDR